MNEINNNEIQSLRLDRLCCVGLGKKKQVGRESDAFWASVTPLSLKLIIFDQKYG